MEFPFFSLLRLTVLCCLLNLRFALTTVPTAYCDVEKRVTLVVVLNPPALK
jgi:hypothetical protein